MKPAIPKEHRESARTVAFWMFRVGLLAFLVGLGGCAAVFIVDGSSWKMITASVLLTCLGVFLRKWAASIEDHIALDELCEKMGVYKK